MPEEKSTRTFFDLGAKLSYNVRISHATSRELSCGMKNIFDSYQPDLDYGKFKDSAYIYGPAMPRMFFFGIKFKMYASP